MYEDFYGLKERPFTLVPDPDYLYLGSQHKLARAHLEYGLKERMGFVVLTGEVGTGKTTLIKSLLREKEATQRLGVLYQTSVEAGDLLDLLLKEFQVRGHFTNRAARLGAFNQFLLLSHARGEHVVLVVDEAQNLGSKALEELRLLSNLQTDKEPLLQVILVGQPGLREQLRHPAMRQLAQRVAIHYHLRPLDQDETKDYIRFRLARAGGIGIFTTSALDKLYQYTQGVPRRINAWCDLALVAGFAEGRHEIDGEFIDLVIVAQGGSLEGTEEKESLFIEGLVGSADSLPSAMPVSHNALESMVEDLSARLTRLEGLALEMIRQMAPVLMKILEKPLLSNGNNGESSFKAATGALLPGTAAGLVATPCDTANTVAPKPIMAAMAEGEPPEASGSGPTPPPSGQDLHQEGDRLEKLERRNRRQKIYWALILAVLGVILATQAYVLFRPLPSSLTGEALVVRDANGKIRASPEQRVRAELNLGPDGEPKFTLRDKRSLQGKSEPSDFGDSSHRLQREEVGLGFEEGTAASPPAGQAEAVSPKHDAETESEFVGSKTSNKYHYPTCKWVKAIKPWNLIKFKSPTEAQARHYAPCPVCKPPPLSR